MPLRWNMWELLEGVRTGWRRTWYAPCEDLQMPLSAGGEFLNFHRAGGVADRLRSETPPVVKAGRALRAEHRDGEVGTRPDGHVVGGWRSEVVGPFENDSGGRPLRYEWSTMLDASYPDDPKVASGARAWQVVFQWHQGDHDLGGSPPVAFTLVGDDIMLDLHRHDPINSAASIRQGQWSVAELDRGTWHDFAAEIVWSVGQGTIRVWRNGQPVTFQPQTQPGQTAYPAVATQLLTGLETLMPRNTQAHGPGHPEAYLKAGIYRQAAPTTPPGPFVIWHDELKRFEQTRIMAVVPNRLVALWADVLPKVPRPPWPPWRSRRPRAGNGGG
jgi:hypothetical protein